MAKLSIPGPCGDEVMEFEPGLVDEALERAAFTSDLSKAHKAAIEAKVMFDNLVREHKMLAITKNPGDREFTKVGDIRDIKENAEATFVPQRQGG